MFIQWNILYFMLELFDIFTQLAYNPVKNNSNKLELYATLWMNFSNLILSARSKTKYNLIV